MVTMEKESAMDTNPNITQGTSRRLLVVVVVCVIAAVGISLRDAVLPTGATVAKKGEVVHRAAQSGQNGAWKDGTGGSSTVKPAKQPQKGGPIKTVTPSAVKSTERDRSLKLKQQQGRSATTTVTAPSSSDAARDKRRVTTVSPTLSTGAANSTALVQKWVQRSNGLTWEFFTDTKYAGQLEGGSSDGAMGAERLHNISTTNPVNYTAAVSLEPHTVFEAILGLTALGKQKSGDNRASLAEEYLDLLPKTTKRFVSPYVTELRDFCLEQQGRILGFGIEHQQRKSAATKAGSPGTRARKAANAYDLHTLMEIERTLKLSVVSEDDDDRDDPARWNARWGSWMPPFESGAVVLHPLAGFYHMNMWHSYSRIAPVYNMLHNHEAAGFKRKSNVALSPDSEVILMWLTSPSSTTPVASLPVRYGMAYAGLARGWSKHISTVELGPRRNTGSAGVGGQEERGCPHGYPLLPSRVLRVATVYKSSDQTW